jgi:hypothetical protein
MGNENLRRVDPAGVTSIIACHPAAVPVFWDDS